VTFNTNPGESSSSFSPLKIIFNLKAFLDFGFTARVYQHQNLKCNWNVGFAERITMHKVQGELVPEKMDRPILNTEHSS
jgi:hypothetical protein